MLAQHLITKPVFDALFKSSEFTKENPVSRAMETVLGQLHEHNLAKESESLSRFYASVERRAADVATARGRQELILKLYDSFFKEAFPVLTQRLGIIYTPVEVVDFIIQSANDALKAQFNQTLGSKGVHILDPFVGTGTFITRLLQSGLITPEELEHKYKREIHANEIVLLAYYIATANIETVYHERAHGGLHEDAPYHPFTGILLTDTFHMYEQERDMVANLLSDNSDRRTRQKELDIGVIIGNPPYSAGQKSEHDNAKNLKYQNLDSRIRDTYAEHSVAGLKQNLYDSYIRAFRWASDRIGDAGVIAFVSGSAWTERAFGDGMRKCLAEEFNDLYVFHLRGDIRKNMLSNETAREGQNIFGSGSMTGISVAVLVKNPATAEYGRIHFRNIGPDLTETQKLHAVRDFGSIDGITKAACWERIIPDKNNDWLDQVNSNFDRFLAIGEKSANCAKIFENCSLGVVTNRDAWCIQSSRSKLEKNIRRLISNYSQELERKVKNSYKGEVDRYVNRDPKEYSWTRSLKNDFKKENLLEFDEGEIVPVCFRPFTRQWQYFGRRLNEQVYQMPCIFPNAGASNLVIQISGVGARSGFSALMCNKMPSLDTIEKGQCYPLYLYEEVKPDGDLFAPTDDRTGFTRRYAITDAGLAHFQSAHQRRCITKEDLFYYIYGLLHSPEYRERFKHNLAKQLPRIPVVKRFDDFKAFRDAGRALGHLHVNFEKVEPYRLTFKENNQRLTLADAANPKELYYVKKMKFGGNGKEKDKSTVIYNENITMQNVPIKAYDYVVNGKSALEWVMARQVVKKDKSSGIINDANDYANETIGDPKYPLDLFRRIITVSLETMKIVNRLPKLDVD